MKVESVSLILVDKNIFGRAKLIKKQSNLHLKALPGASVSGKGSICSPDCVPNIIYQLWFIQIYVAVSLRCSSHVSSERLRLFLSWKNGWHMSLPKKQHRHIIVWPFYVCDLTNCNCARVIGQWIHGRKITAKIDR